MDGEREGVDREGEGEDMIRFGTLKNPVFFLEHWGLFTLGFIHFTKTEVRDYFIFLFFLSRVDSDRLRLNKKIIERAKALSEGRFSLG